VRRDPLHPRVLAAVAITVFVLLVVVFHLARSGS
jgi:hypothetical protein